MAYIYLVGLHGKDDLIRMSCVGGGAANCPGLVGPSEMARWGFVIDFATKRLQIKGSWKQMILNETQHPAICLLDFGEQLPFGMPRRSKTRVSFYNERPTHGCSRQKISLKQAAKKMMKIQGLRVQKKRRRQKNRKMIED